MAVSLMVGVSPSVELHPLVRPSRASCAITAQGPPAGSVASGMGAHRNAQPAGSFLMQSNSHVFPGQRSGRIEPLWLPCVLWLISTVKHPGGGGCCGCCC